MDTHFFYKGLLFEKDETFKQLSDAKLTEELQEYMDSLVQLYWDNLALTEF